MGKINLRPQSFGTAYNVIEDIDGILYEVEEGEVSGTIEDSITVYVTTHPNYLENKNFAGFYVNTKDGFGDVYVRIIDSNTLEIVRNEDINMEIVIY